MATRKPLVIDATTRFAAEYTPPTTSAGASSAGEIPALNASGVLDSTLFPAGIGNSSQTFPATEALAAGAMVNIWPNASTPSVRNANATDATKPAHGVVLAAVASGATATVYFSNSLVTGLSGLTVGAPVYLSPTTAGAVTSTAPSTAGQLMQQVGVASAAAAMVMEIQPGIIRG